MLTKTPPYKQNPRESECKKLWKCAKSWSSQGKSACRQTSQVVMYVPGHGQQGFLRNVFAVIGGKVVEISFLAPGLTLNSRPHTFMEPQNQPLSTINIGLLLKYSTADHIPGTHIHGVSTSTTNCHQVSSIRTAIAWIKLGISIHIILVFKDHIAKLTDCWYLYFRISMGTFDIEI